MASGVDGAKQLSTKLRAIGTAPTAAVRRKARAAALAPIKDAAGEYLVLHGNVITGKLLRGLAIKSGAPNETRFGQQGKHAAVAHLVEYGTAPHWQPNYRGGWMHPGARPFPFVRPAFEAHKIEAIRIYVSIIWAAIVAKT